MTAMKKHDNTDNSTQLAYWNQDEYDEAVHKIHQKRNLLLDIKFKYGEHKIVENKVRVYTDRVPYIGGDVYTEIPLVGEGRLVHLP